MERLNDAGLESGASPYGSNPGKIGWETMKLGGASLAVRRRIATMQPYFTGNGIDMGGGHDSLDRFASRLGFDRCKNWDMPDGDAQYLASVPDGTYDFLHSSHALEHIGDLSIALANWVRVVRGGLQRHHRSRRRTVRASAVAQPLQLVTTIGLSPFIVAHPCCPNRTICSICSLPSGEVLNRQGGAHRSRFRHGIETCTTVEPQ
jgi:Methyltransferase domain